MISPSTSQWVSPGTTVDYQVSLTNNDSGGCAASSFNVLSTVPTGWMGLLDNSIATLNPGATATTILRVTSPSSAVNGYYNISVNASNSSGSTFASSSSVVCAIMSGLNVTVVNDQTSYTKTQTAVITANVSTGGTPVSGASVAFTITKPNGTTAKGTATTDIGGRAEFKYRFKQKDSAGTYQVAAGANLNGVLGSGVTSFTLR
jgi:uncharacterized membrane protein